MIFSYTGGIAEHFKHSLAILELYVNRMKLILMLEEEGLFNISGARNVKATTPGNIRLKINVGCDSMV